MQSWIAAELGSFARARPPPEAFAELRALRASSALISAPCRFHIAKGQLWTCDLQNACYSAVGSPETENNDCSSRRARGRLQ